MINRIIAAVAALLLLVGCTGDSTALVPSAQQPLTLAFATDIHFLSQSLTLNDEYFLARVMNGDGKMLQYIDQITDALVDDLLAQKPDVLVLGGDITLDGEKASHKDFAAKLRKLQKGGVPVLVLSGNHDTNNFLAGSFTTGKRESVDSIDKKEYRKLYGEFGYNKALARDKDSMSYVYPLRSDLWVLLLDVNESVGFNKVSDNTYAWLEQQLTAAQEQGVTVVSVSHQNLLKHNPIFSNGYVISDSDRLVQLYSRNGVQLGLSGHIHLQHVAEQDGFHEVATSALAITPVQYGVVTFNGSTLEYNTRQVDVAGWAQRNAPESTELLGFPATARQLFWDIAYSQSLYGLTEDGINELHAQEMARYYADINTAYFEGTPDARSRAENAYVLWERYEPEDFTFQYIQTMLDSSTRDHNQLRIELK